MRKFTYVFSIIVFAVLKSYGNPPDHTLFDRLLKKYVAENGVVNYKDFRLDRKDLQVYLKNLAENPPEEGWLENEKLAYWINAYNAFTIELILEHYPVESIKDIGAMFQVPFINSVWDIEFFNIGGKEMSLNDIEHNELREKFNEPRIHFAIVCASKSCPDLLPEAYLAPVLDNQLDSQAKRFLNTQSKNVISQNHLELSKIFSWFRGDFTKQGSLVDFIQPYIDIRIDEDAKTDYLDYDWRLNGY